MNGDDRLADLPLADLPLADLCRQCREQTARFRRGEVVDDRFCFEVFHRAIHRRDDGCWTELQNIYRDQVLAWCRRAGAGTALAPDDLVALTWEKFWRYFTPHHLDAAGGTAGALAYLRMCARAVVADDARARARSRPLAAPDHTPEEEPSPADEATRHTASTEFWALIAAALRTERERILVHLHYELGLRSAEVQARRPDLFPSVTDVYRTARNLIDRLKRNPDLRRWFEAGS
jgi:DNA-directed RNA polymerase specialized sigma24 family protein